ncbi:MAG: EAL domain-containing protein [Candidatus Limnocylindria bacterium]
MKVSRVGAMRTPDMPSGLSGRFALGVVAALVAFVACYRLALIAIGPSDLLALATAAVVAIAVAGIALRLVVAPFADVHADLQVRYEAAVADALRDQLTGLGNHRAFHEELERQVAAAQRYGTPLALALVDLDEFKAINDGHGHAAGDRVLRAVGELFPAGLRLADRPYRVGGDEFAVLLPHTDVEGARIVMRRILAQALQPATSSTDVGAISFSCGISALPEFADGAAQLYAQADASLYAAKRGGRTDIVAFSPAAADSALDSNSSAAAVAQVIAHGHLGAVFQPIVSLATGRTIGVEGLIRPLPPAPFDSPATLFAAAEAGGRLSALDLACVETIVANAVGLPADQFLSVNLSPPTMEAPEFSHSAIQAILARHGFPPNRLVIELTEQQQIVDVDRVRARQDACRRLGIRFAADDIGAGNAGLRMLADLRFDILKVDLTLVQRSASDGRYSAVLGSVVDLAARTGAMVIAEGIEHATQLAPLTALGILHGQGYHLGRPGPLERAPEPATRVPELTSAGVAGWRESMGLSTIN